MTAYAINGIFLIELPGPYLRMLICTSIITGPPAQAVLTDPETLESTTVDQTLSIMGPLFFGALGPPLPSFAAGSRVRLSGPFGGSQVDPVWIVGQMFNDTINNYCQLVPYSQNPPTMGDVEQQRSYIVNAQACKFAGMTGEPVL